MEQNPNLCCWHQARPFPQRSSPASSPHDCTGGFLGRNRRAEGPVYPNTCLSPLAVSGHWSALYPLAEPPSLLSTPFPTSWRPEHTPSSIPLAPTGTLLWGECRSCRLAGRPCLSSGSRQAQGRGSEKRPGPAGEARRGATQWKAKAAAPSRAPSRAACETPVSQRVAFLSSGLWILDFQLQNVKGAQHGCWWLTPPHLWLKRPGLSLSGPGGQDAAWAFWISSLWDHHPPRDAPAAGSDAQERSWDRHGHRSLCASSRDWGAASPSWWPRVLCRPLSSHEAGSASPSRSKETQ